jgi:prevent-host-death family protein
MGIGDAFAKRVSRRGGLGLSVGRQSPAQGVREPAVAPLTIRRARAYFSTGRFDRSIDRPKVMREIQASVAKTHLAQLLDEVERGETIVITRHGRAIARLIPDPDHRRAEIREAIENIKAFRQRNGRISIAEILSARHEGHKY